MVCFIYYDLAKQILTPLNKRVKKNILGNSFPFSQNLNKQNAITVIWRIGYKNIFFLVAIVDTRPYKNIKKVFITIVIKVQTVVVTHNINSHVK